MVLLPLAAGIALRAFGDEVAKRWAPRAAFVSSTGLTAVVVLVLLRDGSSIADGLGDGVPLVAAIAVGAALGLGWLAGGPAREARVSTALVTGIRANGPALAIAAASFSGSPDVRGRRGSRSSALGSLALAVVLARGAAGAPPPSACRRDEA
jgi:BASS family bile acid:Na+ symporter